MKKKMVSKGKGERTQLKSPSWKLQPEVPARVKGRVMDEEGKALKKARVHATQ